MISHSAPSLTPADHASVAQALAGMIASGASAARFADAVRTRVGADLAATAASGMDAIAGALRVLGITTGADVVVPTYVCDRVRQAVENVGGRAILADVGDDGNLTPANVAAVRTPATRAIVAAHIFGHPCDIAALRASGLPVVEDACQAFAIPFAAGVAGMQGDVGVYSFQATKCLATGEGGMIVWPSAPHGGPAPGCSELSDLNAALGLSQLARYDDFLARRRMIADRYREALSGRRDLIAHLPEPAVPLYRFTIRSNDGFEDAQDFFAARGISARRGVDAMLHRTAGLDDADFPVASRLFETTISLPCYPALTEADVQRVAVAIEAFAYAD